MIISDSHKFIFSHLYKAGGTSLRSILLPFGRENVKGCHKHSKLKEIKNRIDIKNFQSYYKFVFVRNSWSWQVSLYKYMLWEKTHPQHSIVKNLKNFSKYIRWRFENDLVLQKSFIYDDNGICLADFIGKLGTIELDTLHICKKLKLPYKLLHLNKGNYKNYKDFYNQDTKNIIADAYKEDIETFNFTY